MADYEYHKICLVGYKTDVYVQSLWGVSIK